MSLIGKLLRNLSPAPAQAEKRNADQRPQGLGAVPKLSICIPTYNRAEYLRQALPAYVRPDGVAFDFEVVVVDNCSNDGTSHVIADARPAITNFRSLTQTRTVSAEENFVAALRMARGEFAVYVADDDALIFPRVASMLAYMEQHPEVVACHSPWEFWDKVTEQSQGLSYEVKTARKFDKAASLELYDFIVAGHIFPEIAIYRTQSLHTLLHMPRGAYWAYVFLARAIQDGQVAFLPEPFYRSITRHWKGETREQHGNTQTRSGWDLYRGGVEYFLQRALAYAGMGDCAAESLARYRRGIDDFVANRMMLALMGLTGQQDYMGAHDLLVRLLLWRDIPQENIRHWQAFLCPRAAAQAIVATLDLVTTGNPLYLYAIPESDELVRLLRQAREDLTIVALPASKRAAIFDKDQPAVVITRSAGARDALVQAGFEPGLIIVEAELLAQFELQAR